MCVLFDRRELVNLSKLLFGFCTAGMQLKSGFFKGNICMHNKLFPLFICDSYTRGHDEQKILSRAVIAVVGV